MVLTTVANVAAYLQTTIDGSSTPTDTTVTQWITWADAEIERRTGQKFESTAVGPIVLKLDRYNVGLDVDGMGNSLFVQNARQDFGAFTSQQTGAFHSMKVRLPAKYRPLISMTTVRRNLAGASDADSWETLSGNTGSGGDYTVDLDAGEINIMKNFPRFGQRALEVTFTHGYASVPAEVEALATMLAAQRTLMSSFSNAQNGNWDSVSVADISLSKGGLAGVKSVDSIQRDIDRQWEVVGRLYSVLV